MMHRIGHLTKRSVVTVVTLAVTAFAGAVAITVTGTPATAATCNGYVALTFDDGPNTSTTNSLLSALQSAGVRATLFNIGQRAQQNPSLVQAEQNAGMWIGNHSWTHPHMTQLSASQMASEITQTQQAIQQITGSAPKLFRPPYGETNATLKAAEAQSGLTEIIWDVDSQDWNGASTAQIVQAAGNLQAGGIMLMHDNYQTTIQAIPQIVTNLSSRNLCAGMISPSTGRAVAPDGTTPTNQPTSQPPTSQPPTTSPAGPCQVTYAVSSWSTGLTANITIANTGSSAINGWSLVFTLPSGQTITSGWSATYSPTSGQITARNVSYNAAINPNASVGIGFQVSHTGNTAKPTAFTLNGSACSVA